MVAQIIVREIIVREIIVPEKIMCITQGLKPCREALSRPFSLYIQPNWTPSKCNVDGTDRLLQEIILFLTGQLDS